MPSDRFYLRREYQRPTTTAWVWLGAAMVSAFFLQLVLKTGSGGNNSVLDELRLTARGFQQGHLWTLFTHGLLHDVTNPLHIFFSLLLLVGIGRELEPQLGRRKFFAVFIGSLVLGGLTWVAVHWRFAGYHIGPSAGLMGLLVVLACLYATQELPFTPFFLFSVTMRPMYLVYGFAVLDALLLILYEIPDGKTSFGWAPSAHLGGMLGGWLFFRLLYANNGWDRAATLALPGWFRRKPRVAALPAGNPDLPRSGDLRADVDRILDKINSEGFAALTDAEKQLLDEAKDLLSKH